MTSVLVDTSVWIDHFHSTERALVAALDNGAVVHHPMIVGELALGSLRRRETVLDLLTNLPMVRTSTHPEVLHLVETERLYGRGIGLVDAHLLASVRLTPDISLWTRDRRLHATARGLGIDLFDDVPTPRVRTATS